MTVDLILNRSAKRLADGSGLRDVLVEAARGVADVHETRTLADLGDVARVIAKRGSRAVILAGGDGTYMAGVTALARAMGDALPPIALAPGGTVCTTARNWGMRGDAKRAAEHAVKSAITDGETAMRPTLRVRDDDGGERVGFIFGGGLVSSFFDAYYAAPDPGNVTAAWLVARIFGGALVGGALARRVLSPAPARLDVDGVEQSPSAWSLIAASVVRDLGLGMKLTYRGGERPDRIHAIASALGPRLLAPQMPRVLAGRALLGPNHVDALVAELRVRFGAATAPMRATYILDGDRFTASDVRVTPGPTIRVFT